MNSVGEQISLLDLGTDFLRTSPVSSQAMAVKTSAVSSKRQPKSSKKMPIYLNLRRGGGLTQDVSWAMGIPLLGGSQMHSIGAYRSEGNELLCLPTSTEAPLPTYCLHLNIGEYPREANPTILSDILEEETDPKYELSSKACQGILNRASRRGKQLPEILQKALENQLGESNREQP